MSSCVLIGDEGSLSADYQIDLFTSNQIRWEAPTRINQHDYTIIEKAKIEVLIVNNKYLIYKKIKIKKILYKSRK